MDRYFQAVVCCSSEGNLQIECRSYEKTLLLPLDKDFVAGFWSISKHQEYPIMSDFVLSK
jgi:hypothetical protein